MQMPGGIPGGMPDMEEMMAKMKTESGPNIDEVD